MLDARGAVLIAYAFLRAMPWMRCSSAPHNRFSSEAGDPGKKVITISALR